LQKPGKTQRPSPCLRSGIRQPINSSVTSRLHALCPRCLVQPFPLFGHLLFIHSCPSQNFDEGCPAPPTEVPSASPLCPSGCGSLRRPATLQNLGPDLRGQVHNAKGCVSLLLIKCRTPEPGMAADGTCIAAKGQTPPKNKGRRGHTIP